MKITNHDTENLNNFLSPKNPKIEKDFYDKANLRRVFKINLNRRLKK